MLKVISDMKLTVKKFGEQFSEPEPPIKTNGSETLVEILNYFRM